MALGSRRAHRMRRRGGIRARGRGNGRSECVRRPQRRGRHQRRRDAARGDARDDEAGPELGYDGRLAKLQPAIFAAYDFQFIAEKSVGLAWKDLDAEQRAKLVDVIGHLAAATYAARMADFSGEKFETLGSEPASQDTMLVHTRIVDAKGAPIPLDYRLRNTRCGPAHRRRLLRRHRQRTRDAALGVLVAAEEGRHARRCSTRSRRRSRSRRPRRPPS